MSERVSMPALGESVTEGTVTRWLKSVGEEVAVDEPLLEVSTDKVDTEIPSPVAGVLQEILAEEDETVEVGADLAVVGDEAPSGGSGDDADSAGQESHTQESDTQESDTQEPEPQQDAEEAQDGAGEQTSPAASSGSGAEGGGSGGGETVTMPALGESVTEGTVTRWLKQEGEEVEVDEPLLEVSTDKVDTEIPSPVAGKLTKILAGEDETVEVGGELALIGGEGASAQPSQGEREETTAGAQDEDDSEDLASEERMHGQAAQESQSTQRGGSPSASASSGDEARDTGSSPAGSSPAGSSGTGSSGAGSEDSEGDSGVSAYVTPLVRKLAAKHDVDLESIEGTGVGGRIRKQDVLEAAKAAETAASESAAAQPAAEAEPSEQAPSAPSSGASAPQPAQPSGGSGLDISPKRGTTEKMSRLRKVIAARMVESLQVSAQLTTVVEVDVTKVARLRAATKEDFLAREGVKLSFMPFFALAAVEALKQHPSVNSSIEEDQVVFHAQENLGIAVDTDRGLLVPVVKDAGDLNIAGLARKIADLAERTRTNKIGPDELGGGTFTLTNTGSRGALFDTPILNQPQVGILGTGSVVRRPVVALDAEGGETIAVRSMVYLALTYDHRIVDGADAARFLSTVKSRLEEAAFEV